jgi:hypothetical protein
MSRTVADINNQIVNTLVSNFATIGITIDPNKWSKRNMMRMFCYAVATCQAYTEQLMDLQKTYVENQVLLSIAGTNLWLQSKMFQFQYSETTHQILKIINGVPTYPVIDNTLNIISACSISAGVNKVVLIKCATGTTTLTKLANNQVDAANGYATLIGTEGITYIVESYNPDQIYLKATIYFQKQYVSTIQLAVVSAIQTFIYSLSNTNLNGVISVSQIEQVIKGVAGVNDVVINEMYARADSTPFSSAARLVASNQLIQRNWQAIAGYMIPETTIGNTLNDSLIYISE